MTPTQLKNEIEGGPLAAECAAAECDQDIADILNRKDFSEPYAHMVSARGVMNGLGSDIGSALLNKLQGIADNGVVPVQWAMLFLKSDGGLDVGAPTTRLAIDGLVAASAITQDEGDALKSLAERPAGRAQVLFGAEVDADDVATALRGPWIIKFTPFPGKQTVGSVTAIFNKGQADAFTYEGSANLDIAATMTAFVAAAKAAKAARDASVSQVAVPLNAQQLGALQSLLNEE